MSFFEALGVAGQERIHTQFLAWVLGPKSSPIQEGARAEIVRVLVGDVERHWSVSSLTPRLAMTEVKHIDLLFVLDQHVVFVENKLKARQSPGQLARYNKAIDALLGAPDHFGLWQGQRAPIKVFLNFSGETNVDNWRDVDYGHVSRAMRRLQVDDPFVLSYNGFLSRLRAFRGLYLRHHTAHARVDRNAGLDSVERSRAVEQQQLTEIERFLLLQRLDTVFFEALLYRLGSRLGIHGFHQVGDTRGHALLESTFFECSVRGAPSDVRFRAGAQLQRGSFKLNIGAGESYLRSTREWIAPIEVQLDAAIENLWPNALGVLSSHNARTRAYRSWSMTLPAAVQLENSSLSAFAASYSQRLRHACETWRSVLEQLGRSGVVAHVTDIGPGLQMLEPEDVPE